MSARTRSRTVAGSIFALKSWGAEISDHKQVDGVLQLCVRIGLVGPERGLRRAGAAVLETFVEIHQASFQ